MRSLKAFTEKSTPSKDVVEFMKTCQKLYDDLKNSISFKEIYHTKSVPWYLYLPFQPSRSTLGDRNLFHIKQNLDERFLPCNQLDEFANEMKKIVDKLEKANKKIFQMAEALSEDDKKYLRDL